MDNTNLPNNQITMKIQITYPQTKCKYCGKEFTKQHNRQIYCSDECRKHARQEKRRHYNTRYYYRNKKRILNTAIGTRTISPHKHQNNDREAEIIKNEIDHIGLNVLN